MFKSVLIAEDYESANISVQKTLKDLCVKKVDYVYYCDDALMQIQKGINGGKPYDLLITDLSFEEDDRLQNISNGTALIAAVKKLQPELKVLVFSAEQKPAIVSELFKTHAINGYVRKARRDTIELKSALESIYKNRKHYPAELRSPVKINNAHDFTRYDINIITQLAKGMLKKDIPAYLQEQKIHPAGLSSLEKRLVIIKNALGFSTNEQLVAYCKDVGII